MLTANNQTNRHSKASLLTRLLTALTLSREASAVTDPCLMYADAAQLQCIECKNGHFLTFLSNDRVLCSTVDSATTAEICSLDTYYVDDV